MTSSSDDSSDGALRRALTEFGRAVGPADLEAAIGHLEAAATRSYTGLELGDFVLGEELGRGGMGIVYEAEQRSVPGRRVAVKLLRGFVGSNTALQRFAREVAALGRLDHPSIVPVLAASIQGETPYFAMKLVPGVPLSERLRREDLSEKPREVAAMVRDLARALHHAHERGIVHRDVKPGNILVEPSGRALLTDFGLASLTGDDTRLTWTADAIGTPDYMAPEQVSTEFGPVTPRTDVYGLGVVLYECLGGSAPFVTANRHETMAKVLNAEPARLRRLNRTVDRGLERICHQAMAKKPAQRYPSAAALADDLDRWLAGTRVLARRAGGMLRGRRLLLTLAVAAIGSASFGLALWRATDARAAERLRPIDAALSRRERLERELLQRLAARTETTQPPEFKAMLREASQADARLASMFELCLGEFPDHAPTAARYADFLAMQLRIALEGGGIVRRADRIADLERRLARYDASGRYARLLDHRARLSIACDAGRPHVWLCPVTTSADGRSIAGGTDSDGTLALGLTPFEVTPKEGNWLLRARLDGYRDITLPLLLRRSAVQSAAEQHIDLHFLTPEQIGRGYRQVHAGFSVAVGHDHLPEERGDRLVWVDGFLISEWEVCQGDLDGIAEPLGAAEQAILTDLRLDSIMEAVTKASRRERELGRRFQVDLPTPTEWRRAAQGADGRPYAWGNGFDAAFLAEPAAWRRGAEKPVVDRSPFLVCDLTGSAPEVCRAAATAADGVAPVLRVCGDESANPTKESARLTHELSFSDPSPWANNPPTLRFVRRPLDDVPVGPQSLRLGNIDSPFDAAAWHLVALHGPFRSPVDRDRVIEVEHGALHLRGFRDDFSPVLLAWHPADVRARGFRLELAFTWTREVDNDRALTVCIGSEPGYPAWDDRLACLLSNRRLSLSWRNHSAQASTALSGPTAADHVLVIEATKERLTASVDGSAVTSLPTPDDLPERLRYLGIQLPNYVGMQVTLTRLRLEER